MSAPSTKGRKRLKYGLIEEIRKGTYRESFKNDAMQDGSLLESPGRDYYADVFDYKVRQVGFVEHSEYIGVSPDGLIGEDGIVEIKCPITPTHIGYIDEDVLPTAYKEQVYGQLWVTERKWCDIVSFDPTWKDQMLWRLRIERDEKEIAKVESKINKFVEEIIELMDKMVNSKF